jgi:hypothetical protein
MCGRFTFAIPSGLLAEIFGVSFLIVPPQRYNIVTTQQVL